MFLFTTQKVQVNQGPGKRKSHPWLKYPTCRIFGAGPGGALHEGYGLLGQKLPGSCLHMLLCQGQLQGTLHLLLHRHGER